MSYIGNTSTTQSFTPAIDYFSGNGSTTAFTLSRPVASVAQVQVVIDNVAQNPSSAYTVSNNTITFTSAPLSGTNNIYVYYTSPITQVIAPGQGTVNTTALAGGTVTTTADATLNGLTVGKGGGSVSTNTAVGASALGVNTTGANGVAIGYQALNANTTASRNTAIGSQAGFSVTTDTNNLFIGTKAGYNFNAATGSNTNNTFIGYQAGQGTTTGQNNTYVGYAAGPDGTSTGSQNTALGVLALYTNSSGGNNTALGYNALQANTTASNNTAVGYQAGYTNSTGGNGTFLGYQAGYSSTGNWNTFVGKASGYTTTGTDNTFIGHQAGYSVTTGSSNAFFGSTTAGSYGSGFYVTTGSKNTILGSYNGNQGGLDIRTASNYIVLSDGDGNPRMWFAGTNGSGNIKNSSGGTGTLRAENTNNASGDAGFISVFGANANNTSSYHLIAATGGADKCYIYGNGNIQNVNNSYGALSDIKLKENITDATPKLADLMQVKVRNYNLIGDTTKQIGVVAQELETVFPSMIEETSDRDEEGNNLGTTTKGVKYSVFVPMLIKSIQELKALVDAQATEIAELKAKVGV